ncbi:hypothetical protein T4C_11350, partial [Trichinella pseudospiralis]
MYSTFLHVSLLFKMVHTYMLNIIFALTSGCDKEKLMKQKKVKARMTPSKSWTIHRLTRNEKSYLKLQYVIYTLRARERSNPLKTGFWRCIMQITIAIKVRMKQRKSENADDVKQITDGTLTNKTCEEAELRVLLKGEVNPNLSSARERSNPLKTGFWRCIMQITIAIKIKRMKQRKRENADDVKQITDGTLTNKTCEEVNAISFLDEQRRKEYVKTRRGEAERGRHEAEQKMTRGMRFPVGPHSVSLGLGYFERVKLSH